MSAKTRLYRLLKTKNVVIAIAIISVWYWYTTKYEITAARKYFVTENLDIQTNFTKKKSDWFKNILTAYGKQNDAFNEQKNPEKLIKNVISLEKKLYPENNVNASLSDMISLNRSLPDMRHPVCKKKRYLGSLPTVSVIIPFFNEHWSVLLRTVHSVLNRSPKLIVVEIFLVDDASTKEHLKTQLEDYMEKNIPKVKVLRLAYHTGVVAARLLGAKMARADVLVFLDAHSEVNIDWLPPLLEPILLDYRVVVCPFLDLIDEHTLEYSALDEGGRGVFDWKFWYRRLPMLPKDKEKMPEPFQTPVMGGFFAISKVFFWELGGYDPDLFIWGAEHFELSFKIWLCGGRIIDVPCSRVGHVSRKFNLLRNIPFRRDFFGKNNRRVAEVWMDEYAEYVYARNPGWRNINPGDLVKQKVLRQRLKCKPFNWFMTQVAFDLPYYFPMIEPKPFAEGRISPLFNPKMCVSGHRGNEKERFTLVPCTSEDHEQIFVHTWRNDVKLQTRHICWDVPTSAEHSPVLLYTCNIDRINQQWIYYEINKSFMHNIETCLDYNPETYELFINACSNDTTQQWTIETINTKLMADWRNRTLVTGPTEDFSS